MCPLGKIHNFLNVLACTVTAPLSSAILLILALSLFLLVSLVSHCLSCLSFQRRNSVSVITCIFYLFVGSVSLISGLVLMVSLNLLTRGLVCSSPKRWGISLGCLTSLQILKCRHLDLSFPLTFAHPHRSFAFI